MPVIERFAPLTIEYDRVKFLGILDRLDLSFCNYGMKPPLSKVMEDCLRLNTNQLFPEELSWNSLHVRPSMHGFVENTSRLDSYKSGGKWFDTWAEGEQYRLANPQMFGGRM